MDKYNEIEGQDGIFEIRKMKLMYEVIMLECGFLEKNLSTREIKIIEKESKKWQIKE